MAHGPRRIGVLGGTFDPIHHVHLLIARETARAFGLDEVLFVPVGTPAHKSRVTSAEDRYEMARRAVAYDSRFSVSPVDVRRTGVTYTVDTLTELRRQHGADAQLFFVAGADALAEVPTWRRSAELPGLAHFVGTARVEHALRDPGFPDGRLSLLHIPRFDVSSSLIRARVRDGSAIGHLTPEPVAAYIRERGLYA